MSEAPEQGGRTRPNGEYDELKALVRESSELLRDLAKRQSGLERWALHQQMENHRLHGELAKRQLAIDERVARNDERWLGLACKLDQVIAVQEKHSQILANLPEAIRQKVGFGKSE
ncbi:MAG: hypothetical protein HYV63_29335 [Candidatus Schekmanbacteria bacterium]|nr:hypothetical protein [Candidatus Schekmanbacteria bacterium]